MPGPMSRPDGVKEDANERKVRGERLMAGKVPVTGKTARKRG